MDDKNKPNIDEDIIYQEQIREIIGKRPHNEYVGFNPSHSLAYSMISEVGKKYKKEVCEMEKPEVCEWGMCNNKLNKNSPTFILDGEKYYFCSDKCADEFYKAIKDNY